MRCFVFDDKHTNTSGAYVGVSFIFLRIDIDIKTFSLQRAVLCRPIEYVVIKMLSMLYYKFVYRIKKQTVHLKGY